ncbi:MAG: aldehyde dehydrogenase family protein [Candidatus Edwardsbacteria bacterium]
MQILINGQWRDKREKIEVRNPFDNSLIDTVPAGDASDVEEAAAGAIQGFKEIRSLSSLERSFILKKTAEGLEKQTEDFAVTIAKESGKTIKEARTEVNRAVQTFTIASEEAKRIGGEIIPFDAVPGGEKKFGFYLRVPVGIIAAISPFNFPLNLVAHKLAPGFAGGNSFVLKPATATPLTALKLARLLLESGLPPKALSVVTGWGGEIGDLLVQNPNIRMVTFTGSLEVGQHIMSKIGLKKATMELGSNSAVVIMADADLERASSRITVGGYTLAGQVCISVQRVFVQEPIFEKFLETLLPKVKALKVGNQLEESTEVGPMISESAAKKAAEWIEEAVSLGGKVLCGGERKFSLLQPAILVDVPFNAKVHTEEAFAPLIVANRFRTLEEGMKFVNQAKYGLQAGVFTKDISTAIEAFRKIDVGGVMINEIPTYRADNMPYGGVKSSGLGREGVRFALEEMTELKTVCFHLE